MVVGWGAEGGGERGRGAQRTSVRAHVFREHAAQRAGELDFFRAEPRRVREDDAEGLFDGQHLANCDCTPRGKRTDRNNR